MANQTASITCGYFPDEPHLCEVILYVRKGFAAVSFIACILVVAYVVIFKRYWYFSLRLILYLNVSSVFSSTSYMAASIIPDGPDCQFQAFWMQLWDMFVLLWEAIITLNILLLMKNRPTEKYEGLYIICSVIITVIVSTAPLAGQVYGPSGVYCWIKETYISWRIITWYVPLLGIIALMLASNIYVAWNLRKMNRASLITGRGQDPDLKKKIADVNKDLRMLIGYPLAYFAMAVFPFINRVHNTIHGDENSVFVLVLLHVISAACRGLCNAIVFGWNADTRENIHPKIIWSHIKTWHRSSKPLVLEYPTDNSTPGDLPQSPDNIGTSSPTAHDQAEAKYGLDSYPWQNRTDEISLEMEEFPEGRIVGNDQMRY